MTEKSSAKDSFAFINHLTQMKEIQENYSSFHIKLKQTLQSYGTQFFHSNKREIISTSSTNEDYLSDLHAIIDLLIQNDKTYKSEFEKLSDKFRRLHDILQFPSTIKDSLEKMKSGLASFKRSMNSSIKKLGSNLHYIEKNSKSKYLKSFIDINEKLKKLLVKVIPEELFMNGSIKLKDDYFCKYEIRPSENLTYLSKLKIFKEHSNLLSNIFKVLVKGLVEVFNRNSAKIFEHSPPKSIFKSKFNSPEPAENSIEKKNIIRKISKLVNRGSLTEEEAGRVISNLNEFENSLGAHEDQPLTETRVKACENKSSFYSGADKLVKIPKKSAKSIERLRRRKSNKPILRNLSSSFISPGQNSTKNKAISFLCS